MDDVIEFIKRYETNPNNIVFESVDNRMKIINNRTKKESIKLKDKLEEMFPIQKNYKYEVRPSEKGSKAGDMIPVFEIEMFNGDGSNWFQIKTMISTMACNKQIFQNFDIPKEWMDNCDYMNPVYTLSYEFQGTGAYAGSEEEERKSFNNLNDLTKYIIKELKLIER